MLALSHFEPVLSRVFTPCSFPPQHAAPFQSEGAESCAYTAALCALLSGLRTHPALTSISIRLTNKQRLYQHLLRTRGPALAIPPSLTALWSRVLSVLASLGQVGMTGSELGWHELNSIPWAGCLCCGRMHCLLRPTCNRPVNAKP